MAGVINNTARPIILKHRNKTGRVFKVTLIPGQFHVIPDGEWKLYKKNITVKGLLDEDKLIVSKKAPEPDKGNDSKDDDNRTAEEIAADNQAAIDAAGNGGEDDDNGGEDDDNDDDSED